MGTGSAGPSIVVKVLADLLGFKSAVSGAGDHVQTTTTRMRTAFSGLTSGLNQTGVLAPLTSSIDGVNTALDQVQEHGKSVGTTLLGVGGAVTGIGAALSAVGSKDQAAHQQLQQAVEATGKSYDDYAAKVEDAIKHQEKFGNTADQTQDALRILTQATHDPAEALKLLNQTTDLAAAKHKSLSEAATQVGKVYNGNTKVLKEYGVEVVKATGTVQQIATTTKAAQVADEAHANAVQKLADVQAEYRGKASLTVAEQIRLRDATNKVADTADTATRAHQKLSTMQQTMTSTTQAGTKNLQQLANVTKGQAAAAADTFGGRLKALKSRIEDNVAAFGQKWGPAIQVAGVAMVALGSAMEVIPALLGSQAVAWAGDAVAAAAAAVAENAALLGIPILIAAIVAGIAWMVTHWDKVKAALAALWDWVSSNWPLLLAILFGPFGLAVKLIVDNWTTITKFFGDVWSTIVGLFNAGVSFITGLFNDWLSFMLGIPGAILGVFAGMWNGIYGGAAYLVGLIKGGFNDLVNFVTGLPGRIGSAAAGMWDGIWNAFKGAINLVIRGWNSLDFHIGGGSFAGVDLPEFHLSVPKITPLAVGGIVTAPTLALLGERGPEAVIPLDQARTGPAVVINDAHFSTEVDVELLMRKVAWIARARAI
jgi:hypothetical protein